MFCVARVSVFANVRSFPFRFYSSRSPIPLHLFPSLKRFRVVLALWSAAAWLVPDPLSRFSPPKSHFFPPKPSSTPLDPLSSVSQSNNRTPFPGFPLLYDYIPPCLFPEPQQIEISPTSPPWFFPNGLNRDFPSLCLLSRLLSSLVKTFSPELSSSAVFTGVSPIHAPTRASPFNEAFALY